jgi:hypothetical protein
MFLTLVVVPVVYVTLARFTKARKEPARQESHEAEPSGVAGAVPAS